MVVYWPALSADALSFDDTQYVTKNTLVLSPSWSNAARFLREIRAPSTVRGYYQPLTMISLMVDCAFGGSARDLGPFHVTSLTLHVMNVILVAIVLFLLFQHEWAAAIGAMLWGLHPLLVEPIPWISERKTLLATFFVLLALVCYLLRSRHRSMWYLTASLGFFLLALMSKPTSTPLPVLMLLLDYWPLRRLSLRTALQKIPFFLLSGVFAVITVISQGATAHMTLPGQHNLSRIVFITCHNIVFYLSKVIFPSDLSPHYPIPQPLTLANNAIAISVFGSLILGALLLISLRWTCGLLIGWLFFIVAVFPTLGFIGFTNVIASDKYAYLPTIGFLLPLVAMIRWCCVTAPDRRNVPRWVTTVVVVLLLGSAEAIATRRQLSYWRTSESLFDHMLAVAPNAHTVHNNYGAYLLTEGKHDEALEQFGEALRLKADYADAHRNYAIVLAHRDQLAQAIRHDEKALSETNSPIDSKQKALVHRHLALVLRRLDRIDECISHCKQAIALDPLSPNAYSDLGMALRQAGRADQAVTAYREALELKRDDPGLYNNLGLALADLKRFDEAIAAYRRAIALSSSYADAYTNMGVLLQGMGREDEAIAAYRKAIGFDSESIAAHMKLAEGLRRAGMPEQALAEFRRAVGIDPDYAPARRNVAYHLQESGEVDEAILQYREVLRIEPQDAETYNNLAILYQRQGNLDDALMACREAVRLNPAYSDAHCNLGWLLEKQGATEDARAEYERALELEPTHVRAKQLLQRLVKDVDGE